MTWRHEDDRVAAPLHFFISYSPVDELWATWIAWQLETAGFRTMLQAWDFVAGSNFIDFMDRGVSQSVAVVAILSRHYMRSRYGRLEWQAALRSAPDDPAQRLITVRVDDSPLEGLLSMITFVDLVAVDDPDVARGRLLKRIQETLSGRAKPLASPGFPGHDGASTGARTEAQVPAPRTERLVSRAAPAFPPANAGTTARSGVRLLHLRGPTFGSPNNGPPHKADHLLEAIQASVDWWVKAGGGAPDALVVTGRLTKSGGIREFDQALDFLIQLRIGLRLEPHRLAVVPGNTDITRAACRAYFANCEADELDPRPPYWPKWRHFFRFFQGMYEGIDGATFDQHQPWTLFRMDDLQLVVAGLNSTMADSHLDGDGHGYIGVAQARWFADRLRHFAELGWARVAILADRPEPASVPVDEASAGSNGADGSDRALGDFAAFQARVGSQVETTLYDRGDNLGVGRLGTIITIDRRADGAGFTVDDRPLMGGE